MIPVFTPLKELVSLLQRQSLSFVVDVSSPHVEALTVSVPRCAFLNKQTLPDEKAAPLVCSVPSQVSVY